MSLGTCGDQSFLPSHVWGRKLPLWLIAWCTMVGCWWVDSLCHKYIHNNRVVNSKENAQHIVDIIYAFAYTYINTDKTNGKPENQLSCCHWTPTIWNLQDVCISQQKSEITIQYLCWPNTDKTINYPGTFACQQRDLAIYPVTINLYLPNICCF